jgi:putative glutamine amidotransferase
LSKIVLVTSSRQSVPLNHSSGIDITFTSQAVIDILEQLGCTPIIVPCGNPSNDYNGLIDIAAGLVLVGGQDICPSSYNMKPEVEYSKNVSSIGEKFSRPISLAPDKKRDDTEIDLYKKAKSAGLPILGICRGMQLINIAEGGSLHQEITGDSLSHNIGSDGWVNHHSISIIPSTLLRSVIDKDNMFVSSVHHQCINTLGQDLRVSGTSEDGVIEALESTKNNEFIVGLQGHIEKGLVNSPDLNKIWQNFSDFVKKDKQF